jgi:hypothetical protein
MKTIDLHIHTVPVGDKDALFVFDLAKFQEYTKRLSIDAVAITNHNEFDKHQFSDIKKNLKGVTVFPGIEIDFEGGHLLMISEGDGVDDFSLKCDSVKKEFNRNGSLTVAKLLAIFPKLDGYLLIPHYDKSPKVRQPALEQLKEHIFAGEVSSPKKFNRLLKEDTTLAPVLFSDLRMSADLNIEECQGRQTFVQINSVPTLTLLKTAFKDKSKVFLSKTGKRGFFQAFADGQELSNGLNVIFGERSSGKTFLLDQLSRGLQTEDGSIKYIRQFDLIKEDESKFNKLVEKEKSAIRETYLSEFREVVDDVIKIERKATSHKLEKYIETLVEYASSEKLHDEFSNAVLFTEIPFRVRKNIDLEAVIKAVKLLLSGNSHKELISKYISDDTLRALLKALKAQYLALTTERLKEEWVNRLVHDVGKKLKSKTASPSIRHNDLAFYDIILERRKIARFNAIARAIQKREIINENVSYGKFTIQATTDKFAGAGELLDECGKRVSFSNAFKQYGSPITFLEELKGMPGLEKTELYRYFCKVTYHVLNKYGKRASGGERAEFNLLKALEDARQYEMLLLDEPESSFDNLFLKDGVNKEIKELSKELPIVVVTHNNTVGMLMYPDYILYTQRQITSNKDYYKVFAGTPGDKVFKTVSGESINSYDVLMNALEAGEGAYNDRSGLYKGFKS